MISPFIMYCKATLPTAFGDELSYYETLTALTNFLNNQVLPVVNKNDEKVAELTTLVNNLENYIENYFDNLDVQEEINHKLDEMVSSGQLEDLLFNFFKINVVFNTVAEMKKDVNLQVGQKVSTLGYYTVNDGGGAQYIIKNSTTSNKYFEELNNNLFAELIIYNTISPLQLGAYGNGTNNDTLALKNSINIAKNYNVILTSSRNSKYLVSENIVFNTINVDFNNSIIMSNSPLEHLLTINSINPGNYTHLTNTYKNIILSGKNITSSVLYVACNKTLIESITINDVAVAGMQLYQGFENTVRKCNINGDTKNKCTGILINGNDHLLEDIVIIDCNTGISVRGNNRYVRIHTWFYTKELVQDSKCFLLNSGFSYFLQCYSDTCQYGFYWKNYSVALIVNHSFFCANSEYLTGLDCYSLYTEDRLYVQNNLSIVNTYSQGYNNGNVTFSNFSFISDKTNIGRDADIIYYTNENVSLKSQYFNLIRGKLITLNNDLKIFDAVVTVDSNSVRTHNPITIFKLPPPKNNIISSAMWDTEDFGLYKGSVGYTLLINSGNLAVRLNPTTDNNGLIYISFHIVYF